MTPKEEAMNTIIKIDNVNFNSFDEIVNEICSRRIDIALKEQSKEYENELDLLRIEKVYQKCPHCNKLVKLKLEKDALKEMQRNN